MKNTYKNAHIKDTNCICVTYDYRSVNKKKVKKCKKKQRAIYLCIINKSTFLRRSMNPQYKTVKCINRCH